MLRAGTHKHGRLVGDNRSVLFKMDWCNEFEKKIRKTSNMNMKWKQKANVDQKKDLEESTLELRQTLGIA